MLRLPRAFISCRCDSAANYDSVISRSPIQRRSEGGSRRTPRFQIAVQLRCRGLPPALVDAGFGLFAAVLRHRRIVRVSFFAAAVIRRWIVDVEGSANAQPLGQIRIGDELAAESNQIGLVFAKPPSRAVSLEATCHDQGSLVVLPDQLDHA